MSVVLGLCVHQGQRNLVGEGSGRDQFAISPSDGTRTAQNEETHLFRPYPEPDNGSSAIRIAGAEEIVLQQGHGAVAGQIAESGQLAQALVKQLLSLRAGGRVNPGPGIHQPG